MKIIIKENKNTVYQDFLKTYDRNIVKLDNIRNIIFNKNIADHLQNLDRLKNIERELNIIYNVNSKFKKEFKKVIDNIPEDDFFDTDWETKDFEVENKSSEIRNNIMKIEKIIDLIKKINEINI